jgi:hypothetical protein
MQCIIEELPERHMEGMTGSEEGSIEENLVWFMEREGEAVGLHDFAVLFRAFGPHLKVVAGTWCDPVGTAQAERYYFGRGQ